MIERPGLDAEALKLRRLRVHLGVARDRRSTARRAARPRPVNVVQYLLWDGHRGVPGGVGPAMKPVSGSTAGLRAGVVPPPCRKWIAERPQSGPG